MDLSTIKYMWPEQVPGRDQARQERRVINEDPTLSLHLYSRLKARDVCNFGVSRSQLARTIIAYKRNPRAVIAALH